MKYFVRCISIILGVVLLVQCKRESNVDIPDDNFLIALINAGIDSDGDGQIGFKEAEAVTYLDVSGTYETPGEIENINGIEAFINLETLICSYNQITFADISSNKALVSFSCGSNLLTELDISANTALISLHCWSNQLIALDVSGNIALELLDCDANELTGLELSDNTVLTNLYCGRNQISSLDLSGNTALEFLYCASNQLTSLDLSDNVALTSLLCDRNQISILNVSSNVAINTLLCFSNQLSTLDVSVCSSLKNLDIHDMPSLYKVCVWELPFPPEEVVLDTTGSPNVYFTTDCNK